MFIGFQGAVSINNYTISFGTIVVPVGALNFCKYRSTLDGRILTIDGAITTAGWMLLTLPVAVLMHS